MATRARIRVEGVVQGVGFRPFVHRAATARGLAGFVHNDGTGALIEVEGAHEAIEAFLADLAHRAPALARIERVARERIAPTGETRFRIGPSETGGERHALIAADVATCEACLVEVFDPANRRYRQFVWQSDRFRTFDTPSNHVPRVARRSITREEFS